MKKYVFIMMSILFILAFSGCKTDEKQQSAAAPSPTVETATSVPTPMSTPLSTPSLDPMQKKLQLVPEIDGLTKTVEEKDGIQKVVYWYATDNPYGGMEGEYAGEYYANIDFEVEHGESFSRGGICLKPEVVDYLIDLYQGDYLANLGMDPDQFFYPIPLDISQLTNEQISLCFHEDYTISGSDFSNVWTINFDELSLPFISINFGKEDVVTDYIIQQLGEDGPVILFDSFSGSDEMYESLDENGYFYDAGLAGRVLAYTGDFSLEYTVDEYSDFIIGSFIGGEKICDVSDSLTIIRRRSSSGGWASPFEVGFEEDNNSAFVFVCSSDS